MTQRWQVDVHVLPMANPADWSALDALVQRGAIDPRDIIAVLGKTEGNGCVNDFTRAYASSSLELRLRQYGLEDGSLPVVVMSGGTEGVLSPHATVFTRRTVSSSVGPAGALMISGAQTEGLAPEDLGRMGQVQQVAAAVRTCLAEGQIAAQDAAFVQVKCPLLTAAQAAEAERRGRPTATADTYHSMALSRAASALGVALALGEVHERDLSADKIGSDWALFSSVASTSSGIELSGHHIFVLGTSQLASGPLRVGHSCMEHPLDQAAYWRALNGSGAGEVLQVLAKAEAPPDGEILGARHTMLDDSDIPHSRMARSVVGAVLAAASGRTRLYVSGGAEHQGPSGGGPLAVIWREKG